MMMPALRRTVVTALLVSTVVPVSRALAQDLFEIQVYPYDTVEPGRTMLEFHMNFIPSGTSETADGLYANNHQFHVTLELTHGWTPKFETGFYLESAYVPGIGYRFTNARPS